MADLELAPTGMAAGGAAIARDGDGRVVFIEGALPGERVRATVTDERKDFARAVAVEILEASPDRIAPPCAALAAGCGGCSWQHVERGAQGRLKLDIVRDALRRIGRFTDAPDPVLVPVEQAVLRTTARLGVDADGRAGHRRAHSNEVISAEDCAAVHPLLEDLIVAGRYRGADEVVLRVGVASGERMVLPRPREAKVRVPRDVKLGGVVHEDVAGRRFRISAQSFFQPGPVAAEALVTAVESAVGDALGAGDHLVDAYGGVGLFGSVLGARRSARVTTIEQDRGAAADAAANLGDVEGRVLTVEVARWHPTPGEAIAAVVADPSRPGLGRPGAAAVVRSLSPRIVLVSCDPASLARDARLLADAGYRLSALEVVDTFPDTFHVEVVTRFDRLVRVPV